MTESSEIKISVRQSNGEQFEVSVAADATVLDLKTACVNKCSLPPESQRLIFKGKNGEACLELTRLNLEKL